MIDVVLTGLSFPVAADQVPYRNKLMHVLQEVNELYATLLVAALLMVMYLSGDVGVFEPPVIIKSLAVTLIEPSFFSTDNRACIEYHLELIYET